MSTVMSMVEVVLPVHSRRLVVEPWMGRNTTFKHNNNVPCLKAENDGLCRQIRKAYRKERA